LGSDPGLTLLLQGPGPADRFQLVTVAL